MIIIDFGVTNFSWKADIIFGDTKQYELKTLRVGLITLTFMPNSAQNILVSAMSSLTRDRDWLINNAPSVRHAKRKAIAKARAADAFSFEALYEESEKIRFERDQMIAILNSENKNLRNTIKIITDGEDKGLEG